MLPLLSPVWASYSILMYRVPLHLGYAEHPQNLPCSPVRQTIIFPHSGIGAQGHTIDQADDVLS